jgi:hypothetical protein
MLRFGRFCINMVDFGLRLVRVRSRAAAHATAYLHGIEQQFGGSFNQPSFKKVVKSHSVYLPIVNDAFTLLHGRYTTQAEQERSIHYFICSTLFDNFWDDQTHTSEQIAQMMFAPATYPAQTFDERVFVASHLRLLQDMPDTTAYQQVLQQEFKAQQASMGQFDAAITNAEIERITFAKGGNAVLMCRYYLDVTPTPEEEQCWYLLGNLIQLSNDLFDIYKDLQDGIHTLATRCTNAYEMETLFMQKVQQLQHNLQQLPYPRKRKRRFGMAMAATYVLGLVAIDQLKALQGNAPVLPDFKSLPRKALIVDMEKVKNMWKWVRLVYRNH